MGGERTRFAKLLAEHDEFERARDWYSPHIIDSDDDRLQLQELDLGFLRDEIHELWKEYERKHVKDEAHDLRLGYELADVQIFTKSFSTALMDDFNAYIAEVVGEEYGGDDSYEAKAELLSGEESEEPVDELIERMEENVEAMYSELEEAKEGGYTEERDEAIGMNLARIQRDIVRLSTHLERDLEDYLEEKMEYNRRRFPATNYSGYDDFLDR